VVVIKVVSHLLRTVFCFRTWGIFQYRSPVELTSSQIVAGIKTHVSTFFSRNSFKQRICRLRCIGSLRVVDFRWFRRNLTPPSSGCRHMFLSQQQTSSSPWKLSCKFCLISQLICILNPALTEDASFRKTSLPSLEREASGRILWIRPPFCHDFLKMFPFYYYYYLKCLHPFFVFVTLPDVIFIPTLTAPVCLGYSPFEDHVPVSHVARGPT
jgi:hypothetical protein